MSEANLFDKPEPVAPSERLKRTAKRKRKVTTIQHGDLKQQVVPLAVHRPETLVEIIARIASDPAIDTDKMRAVIEIQRDTEAKQQFHDAMVAMDGVLPKVNRDGKIAVRGGVLRFASFENINKVIKPILRGHGFRMTYEPDVPASGQGIIVHCHLTRGLYRESCTVPVPSGSVSPAMNAQQAVGAAISYAKRYGTIALLNLETEAPEDRDTDANVAPETITGPQAKKLLKLADDNGVPLDKALEKFGIAAIHELPAKQYSEFEQACKNYGARKAAKQ